MALWNKLKGLFKGEPEAPPEPEAPAGPDVEAVETVPGEQLLLDLADADLPVEPAEVKQAVESLRREGHELRAVELLGRALRARPDEVELQAALAFLLVARVDYEAAAPLLLKLTRSLRHGLQAELLLGEKAEHDGELTEALRHYERVLAKDVTHGQALNRARRLREKLGASASTAAQATMVQPEGVATQGRYQLLRELGRGGAAAVYLATDRHIERQVALKVYHPQIMSEDGPDQLAREAALPGRIDHPGIIKVLDVDAELGALVMEVVEGGSFKDLLKKGTLGDTEALVAVESVCRPLAALHDAGIVHRDIKPGNILLRGGDVEDPVLTDLGVALLPGESHQPGIGTPAFMAPEQGTEDEIDARADIYAVGVMLAAMLGGYPGPTGPVGDLLDRCLSESPGGRPRHARELGRLAASVRYATDRQEEYCHDLERVAELSKG